MREIKDMFDKGGLRMVWANFDRTRGVDIGVEWERHPAQALKLAEKFLMEGKKNG